MEILVIGLNKELVGLGWTLIRLTKVSDKHTKAASWGWYYTSVIRKKKSVILRYGYAGYICLRCTLAKLGSS